MTDTAETPKTPLCFVIGPIGKDGSSERKHADLLLHAVIKEVLGGQEFGYRVKRADEDADPGMIGDRMISDIAHAELVVVDLTDLNPNAFYELGIRHSTLLPTIHIAKSGTPLPFDNVAHRTIFVDLTDWRSIEDGRASLAKFARAIKDPEYRVSNPITQANASFQMRESADPRDRVIAELQERIGALELRLQDLRRLPREQHTATNPTIDPSLLGKFINQTVEARVEPLMSLDEIKYVLQVELATLARQADSYLEVTRVEEAPHDATSLIVTVQTADGPRAYLAHKPRK
jgi:hypothetical protein